MVPGATPSLGRRHLLAPLALTLGFYGLVLLLAAGMLAVPVLLHVFDGAGRGLLQRFGTGASKWLVPLAIGLIAASWPRRDRWRPRALLVTEKSQARLFAAIRAVAARCRAPMPDDVYLTLDLNASVTHGGGRLGLGQRRILCLGLPLLQLFPPRQVEAVLAHEFGHFAAGHTRYGAWAYRTRTSMVRVASKAGEVADVLQFLFRAYAHWFLRATRVLARHQELEADAFAARAIGAEPLAGALRRVGPASVVLSVYVQQEFLPVVERGRRPPFLEGFARFAAAPRSRQVWSAPPCDDDASTVDPYDSHPPLPERLAQLGVPVRGPAIDDALPAGSAIDWIAHRDEVEAKVLQMHLRFGDLSQRPAIAWAEVATEVLLPDMRRARAALPQRWRTLALADLGDQSPHLRALGADVLRALGHDPDRDDADLVAVARAAAGKAALAALAASGWRLERRVGEATVATRGDAVLAPHTIWNGRAAADDWRRQCERNGVAALPLGADEPEAAAGPDPEPPPPAPAPVPRRSERRRRPRTARPLRIDTTGWKALGMGVAFLLVVALCAGAVYALRGEHRPQPDEWPAVAATFVHDWNTGDLAAIEADCLPEHRDRLGPWLRQAVARRGWQARPPQLVATEARRLGDDRLAADYVLPVGTMETRWRWHGGRWWLAAVVLPTKW